MHLFNVKYNRTRFAQFFKFKKGKIIELLSITFTMKDMSRTIFHTDSTEGMGKRNLYFDASREAEFNCIQVRQKYI